MGTERHSHTYRSQISATILRTVGPSSKCTEIRSLKSSPLGHFLSRFDIVIGHIDGDKNIFADLLTRWSRGYRLHKAMFDNMSAIFKGIIPSAYEPGEPLEDEVCRVQQIEERPTQASMDSSGIWIIGNKIWIPLSADALKSKTMIKVHSSNAQHRGKETTRNVIQEKYVWKHLRREYINLCSNSFISSYRKLG